MLDNSIEAILHRLFHKEVNGSQDFRMAVNQVEGGFDIIIHPMGKDGKTVDLKLRKISTTYLTIEKK